MDRMDRLVAEAVRCGFRVWQTKEAGWMFQRGDVTLTVRETPGTVVEWMWLIGVLRSAGLVFPPDGD
jgi:hypothetical protein